MKKQSKNRRILDNFGETQLENTTKQFPMVPYGTIHFFKNSNRLFPRLFPVDSPYMLLLAQSLFDLAGEEGRWLCFSRWNMTYLIVMAGSGISLPYLKVRAKVQVGVPHWGQNRGVFHPGAHPSPGPVSADHSDEK
jgi:hypothetical protein